MRLLTGLDDGRRVNVHAREELAFRQACQNGHVDTVRFLLSLDGDRCIDVHINGEQPFVDACLYGQPAVLLELLSLRGARRINGLAALQRAMSALLALRTCPEELVRAHDGFLELLSAAQSGDAPEVSAGTLQSLLASVLRVCCTAPATAKRGVWLISDVLGPYFMRCCLHLRSAGRIGLRSCLAQHEPLHGVSDAAGGLKWQGHALQVQPDDTYQEDQLVLVKHGRRGPILLRARRKAAAP